MPKEEVKKRKISDDEYTILLKYFEGDIKNLDVKKITDTSIDDSILKMLKKYQKVKNSSDWLFIYPEWTEEMKEENLKRMFPDDIDSSSDLESPDLGDWADLSIDDDSSVKEPVKVEPVKVEPIKDIVPDDIRYTADHPKWGKDDSIRFYKNGTFKRVIKKNEIGKWDRINNELILNWKNWDPEILITDDNGETFKGENGFILNLSKSPIVKKVPEWFKEKKNQKFKKPKKIPEKKIEYDLKKPYTINLLLKEIKELTDKPKKNKEENDILKELKKIQALTNIQFQSVPKIIKDKLQFNLISSFSTTEFTIADDMSKYILSIVDKSSKFSKLSITDATSCIGGNTISFAKFFSNVYSIELEEYNFNILENNIKISKELKDKYKPPLNGNINIFNDSYENVISSIKDNDIIFFDPPWTKEGVPYNKKNPDVPELGDKDIFQVIDNVCKIYKHVFVKLPANLKVDTKEFKVKKYDKMILIYKNCSKDLKKPDKKDLKKPDKKDLKKVDKLVEPVKDPKDEYKYILSQRKAYVDFINNEFYNKLMMDVNNDDFKNYQKFVKGYLSLETPFRGLLVYHGLGTGKTATAIITTEGLSEKRINTFLPKSLKENFVSEIKNKIFTGDEYDISANNWQLHINEDLNNPDLIESLKKYDLNENFIKNVLRSTKREVKEKYPDKISDIQKGIFIKITDYFDDTKEIYTTTGELIKNDIVSDYGNINKLSDINVLQLENQINEFILDRYNFIHSNALPTVDAKQLSELDLNLDSKTEDILIDNGKKLSDRQDIMNKFLKKLKINKKKNILSPFNNEVIVIDEVHNLISKISNKRGPSLLFYEWIINSVDTKLIFLSGTPIINKPSEIAYLFNMLKGRIDVYDFVLNMNGDIEEISRKLKEIFYDNISCIEQLNVKKYKGKIIVSIIKTNTNFSNILDEDGVVKTIKYGEYTYQEFFKQVYTGLHKFTEPSIISPTYKEIQSILKSKEINKIIQGSIQKVFDEDTKIIFNKNHKLFEIYNDDGTKIDLSDNNEFMDYFFDEQDNIPPKKQVHLRRMLMGLTSYYPIDRSAISYMPEIVEPFINIDLYKNYSISKKINLVPCYMSYEQFTQYEIEHNKQVEQDLRSAKRKNMYDDSTFHYYGGTRQVCNISYNEPGDQLTKYRLMNESNNFNENLELYSPKMFQIMKNMNRFIKNDKPTGKVLLYSTYKSEGGSGAFEQVLIAHGYEKYDYQSNNIDNLIKTNDKKKRYTFITGEQDEIEKQMNKESYNNIENINGEYIQVMLISESGAEGISLTCVRQVHILEPFWNNVRIDQVFGRAIRRNSHIGPDSSNPWLPKDQQNVEQYLYLSLFPEGNNTKDIFKSIKELNWIITQDTEYVEDNFEQHLLSTNEKLYVMIQNIINIKAASKSGSTDQLLFDIMERKYNINEKLNDIIKESSVDCIKHTTDDPILNNKCIQFSEKLKQEIAYFPGLDTDELNLIDNIQLKSKYTYLVNKETVVISGTSNNENVFSYYKINPKYREEKDIRYIKENGRLLCDYFIDRNKFYVYEDSKYYLNNKITSKFSVIQSIYNLNIKENNIYDEYISKQKFPNLDAIRLNEYLEGYKIKYNVNDKLFFTPKNNHDLDIYKLYDYKKYNETDINNDDKCFIIHYNKNFYELN